MSIDVKVKKSIELIGFSDHTFLRMPWDNGSASWYELSDVNADWLAVTSCLLSDELEAHWYDEKGGY